MLRSGSRKGDIPFVAKISSLWQESGENDASIDNNYYNNFGYHNYFMTLLIFTVGGLMMTVFWYYRREDTDTVTLSQFIEVCAANNSVIINTRTKSF